MPPTRRRTTRQVKEDVFVDVSDDDGDFRGAPVEIDVGEDVGPLWLTTPPSPRIRKRRQDDFLLGRLTEFEKCVRRKLEDQRTRLQKIGASSQASALRAATIANELDSLTHITKRTLKDLLDQSLLAWKRENQNVQNILEHLEEIKEAVLGENGTKNHGTRNRKFIQHVEIRSTSGASNTELPLNRDAIDDTHFSKDEPVDDDDDLCEPNASESNKDETVEECVESSQEVMRDDDNAIYPALVRVEEETVADDTSEVDMEELLHETGVIVAENRTSSQESKEDELLSNSPIDSNQPTAATDTTRADDDSELISAADVKPQSSSPESEAGSSSRRPRKNIVDVLPDDAESDPFDSDSVPAMVGGSDQSPSIDRSPDSHSDSSSSNKNNNARGRSNDQSAPPSVFDDLAASLDTLGPINFLKR